MPEAAIEAHEPHPCDYAARLTLVIAFAVAMAFVEAAVVVYLRALFYPEGFALPLKILPARFVAIELVREFSTLIMLLAVAVLAGKKLWERFGWFAIAFGVWDIFYYIWLRVTLGWPESLFEWDVLFLIPIPWIGPVIAPVLVALLLTAIGVLLTRRYARGGSFRPTLLGWVGGTLGAVVILYSFMRDTAVTLELAPPGPYWYPLLVIGLICALLGFAHAYRASR
jgi:hypothetical protein